MKHYCITVMFWFITLHVYLWLHEFAGHYFANLLSGISIDQMEIIWLKLYNINISPWGVTVLDGEPPKISYFAGGFVAGLLLLLLSILLFLRLYRKKKQELFWWFFAITLGFSGAGFTEFIIEGFYTEYHRSNVQQRGSLEFAIVLFFIFLFPLLLSSWHYRSRIFDMVKQSRKKNDKIKKYSLHR